MEKDRQRLIEDRKALQDAIKRAMTANDEEEVKRLSRHLAYLENYLKEKQK